MAQQTKRVGYGTVMLHILTRGRLPRSSASDPIGFLELTTTGRKSGLRRTVSLIYMKSGPDYVVIASNGGRDRHPGWYHNVRTNPQVTVRTNVQQFSAVAEVVSPMQRPQLWERLTTMAPMYKGYEKRTQREIPMVLLRPVEATEAQQTT
jgi:deazaflavin-dependent oxidoreductase (nitroreductase family)